MGGRERGSERKKSALDSEQREQRDDRNCSKMNYETSCREEKKALDLQCLAGVTMFSNDFRCLARTCSLFTIVESDLNEKMRKIQ